MIFKLRKTKRKKMIIYKGSGHMTSGCVTVRDTIDMDYVQGFGKELNDKLRRQLGTDDDIIGNVKTPLSTSSKST